MRRVGVAVALTAVAACGTAPPEAQRTVWADFPKHERHEAADPTAGLGDSLAAAVVRTHVGRVRATRSKPRRSEVHAGCGLEEIRRRESGGDYGAVSASGKYRGAYQFDRRTWESVGGSGDPAGASAAEQDARAAELLRRRGTQPWSVCR